MTLNELKSSESCPTCHRITHGREIKVTCDICQKDITEEYYNKSTYRGCYKIQVFHGNDHTNNYHFCSWKHYFKWLKYYDSHFEFISLEYVTKEELKEFQEYLKKE